MSVDSLVEQYHQAEADRYEHLAMATEATRQKAIMVYRLHNTHNLTMAELGEMFGVTKQRIFSLIQLVKS